MADLSQMSNEELLSSLSNEDLLAMVREKPKTYAERKAAIAEMPAMQGLGEYASMAAEPFVNFPRSVGGVLGGVYHAVTHPVDTAKGIYSLATMEPQAVSAVKQLYADKYGGAENIQRTLAEDPAGMLADLSAVTGLAGGAMRLGGRISGSQGLRSVGEAVTQGSNAINPINMAYEAAKNIIAPAIQSGYGYIAGTSSTVGKGVMDEAFNAKIGSDYSKAKSGIIGDEEVVKDARNALGILRENRNAAFKADVPALENVTTTLPLDKTKNVINSWAKNLRASGDFDTGIDLSKSRAVQESASEIQNIIDDVRSWSDMTPAGLDTLRQRIGSFNTTTPTSSKVAADIAESLKETISSAVPGYRETLSKYAKASETIDEMQRALSLRDQGTIDSAIRKLIITMKHDSEFRGMLLKELDTKTGGDLTAKIAGRAASPLISGRLGTMATAVAAGGGAYLTHNPALLGIMALASPKMATALARGLGITGRGLDAVLSRSVTPALSAQQLGQLAAQDNERQ